jgi:hypothetical protein
LHTRNLWLSAWTWWFIDNIIALTVGLRFVIARLGAWNY